MSTFRPAYVALAVATALGASAAVATTGGAQDPSPAPMTLELTAADRESRFRMVDNPPRSKESAGDMFTISSRLRDTQGALAGRLSVAFVQTSSREAHGTGTFILADGRIAVSGVEQRRGLRVLAVTGGTGAYAGSTGTLTLSDTRGGTRFRFLLGG